MKKVFLDELPKRGKNINWKEIIVLFLIILKIKVSFLLIVDICQILKSKKLKEQNEIHRKYSK